MEGYDQQHILHLLQQLLDYSRKLSECEQNPDLDVAALTRTCKNHLSELQQVIPAGLAKRIREESAAGKATEQDLQILESMKLLEVQTQECVEILRNCRDKAESELSVLRQNQKASRAYRGRF